MAKAVPFHSKDYWESRFEKEEHFEWLLDWSSLEPFLKPYLKDPILHLGCGTSTLALDLKKLGYNDVVNVDYASNVIARMKERYPDLTWITADCLRDDLMEKLTRRQFSLVIDKSLCDTIACGDDDQETQQRLLARQVLSVTQPGGVWISISFSKDRKHVWPTSPGDCQEEWAWSLERTEPIKACQSNDNKNAPEVYNYIYVMRKVRA